MLSATPELVTFLNTTTANGQGQSLPAVTITLKDGSPPLRWVRWNADVSFGGTTWLAHGQAGRPSIGRFHWRTPIGLREIGKCSMELLCGDSAVLGSKRMTLAAAEGAFDDATFLLERLYRLDPASSVIGKLFRFAGTIVAAPPTSHSVRLEVENATAKMRAAILPNALVSPSCQNALFDTVCGAAGLSKTAHTSAVTIQAGSSKNVLVVSGSWSDGDWDLGYVEITSGTYSGTQWGIRTNVGTSLRLSVPMPGAPAAGVTANLVRGCDHTTGPKGCARFANIAQFRGTPLLPKEV